MRLSLVPLVLFCIGLAGCASAPPHVGTNIATPGMPNPQLALNRAIMRTDQAVSQMNDEPVASLASARLPPTLPAELDQPIEWHYSGRLIPAVKALARIVNFHVAVERVSDHHAIPVTVNSDHTPVATLLRDLGEQAGDRARIDIDARSETITIVELAHRPSTTRITSTSVSVTQPAALRPAPVTVTALPALTLGTGIPQSLIAN